MPDKTWKAFERAVARDFGGTRVGGKGDNELRKSFDVYSDEFIIECKLRATWPTPAQIVEWCFKLLERTKDENKIPRLCVKIGGKHGYWIVGWTQDMDGNFILSMYHNSWR